MTFSPELLGLLCCPETHQSLAVAEAAAVADLNARIAAGTLRNRAGEQVRQAIEGGLIRQDGRYLYPIRDRIPVLLVEEALPVGDLGDLPG